MDSEPDDRITSAEGTPVSVQIAEDGDAQEALITWVAEDHGTSE